VNACRDHHRRNARWTRVKGGLAVLAASPTTRRPRSLPAKLAHLRLARLKPLLRETFVLVVREDMSHAEAARALGVVSPPSPGASMKRAKNSMPNLMEHCDVS